MISCDKCFVLLLILIIRKVNRSAQYIGGKLKWSILYSQTKAAASKSSSQPVTARARGERRMSVAQVEVVDGHLEQRRAAGTCPSLPHKYPKCLLGTHLFPRVNTDLPRVMHRFFSWLLLASPSSGTTHRHHSQFLYLKKINRGNQQNNMAKHA